MKMCDEMIKLRKKLDEIGVAWQDDSYSTPENVVEELVRLGHERRYCDVTIYRTHFIINDVRYSVINGYGTYGGYDPFLCKNDGLLEMMTETLNGGDPVGYMTADDVIKTIFGRKKNAFEDYRKMFDGMFPLR